MRFINPSYEIIEQKPGLEGIYGQIELAGRTCYKSERKEGTTAKDFVRRMIASKHFSMLEHGTVYLTIPCEDARFCCNLVPEFFLTDPYSKAYRDSSEDIIYVTTNLRVLIENKALGFLRYICEPTEYHEKRVTVRFISNIHFYKDLTRHRKMSYAIESTRYCNYSKGKFGNQITFIIPAWTTLAEGMYDEVFKVPSEDKCYALWDNDQTPVEITDKEYYFLNGVLQSELAYLDLINICKWKAEQAAEVLPQATKADVICTGFISDWEYIFNLRTSIIAETGKPHPEVSRLMNPLYKEFKARNLIKDEKF